MAHKENYSQNLHTTHTSNWAKPDHTQFGFAKAVALNLPILHSHQ